jgi:Glycosyl hydrolases family 18
MRSLIATALLYTLPLAGRVFTLAKPLQRPQDVCPKSPHHVRRELLTTHSDSSQVPRSRLSSRDRPATRSYKHKLAPPRLDNDNYTPPSGWGSWRTWGPYAARNGDEDGDGKNTLGQLIQNVDTSLDALFAFLAREYQIDQPPSAGSNHTSSRTQSLPSTTPTILRTTIIPIPPFLTTSTGNSAPSISPSADYVFDPLRPDLNVVDPAIDIIILAFVNRFLTSTSDQKSAFPTLNLASECWAANFVQVAAGASTLVDCVSSGFAAEVAACQEQGKKVLLSLGGAVGYSDTDDAEAMQLADIVWDLFLSGSDDPEIQQIRPFGDVVLDGIDIGKSFFSHAFTGSSPLHSFGSLPKSCKGQLVADNFSANHQTTKISMAPPTSLL